MEAGFSSFEYRGKMKFAIEIIPRVWLMDLGESDQDYGRIRFDAKRLRERLTDTAVGGRLGEKSKADHLSRETGRLPIRKVSRRVFGWQVGSGSKEILTIYFVQVLPSAFTI
jgi:hypothetical protein